MDENMSFFSSVKQFSQSSSVGEALEINYLRLDLIERRMDG